MTRFTFPKLLPLFLCLAGCFGNAVDNPPREEFPICHGPHQVRLLEHGHEALLIRIHLIRQAKESINFQSFIWTNDEAGRLMMFELLEAAKRGVKVRLLVDQMFSHQNIDHVAYISTAHPNLEIRLYNPPHNKISSNAFEILGEATTRFKKFNQRMHNKVLTIDEKQAIVGGRNVENTYYDQSTGLNFKDREIYVKGPVVSDIVFSFERFWNFELSIPSRDLTDVAEIIFKGNFKRYETVESFDIDRLQENLKAELDRIADLERTINRDSYSVNKLSFFSDRPGKNSGASIEGNSDMANSLRALFLKSEQSILLQTPYLVLSNSAKKMFKACRDNHSNIDITVSTNSLAATDSWPTYAMSFKDKRSMLRTMKMNLYEFKPIPGDLKEFFVHYDDILKKTYLDKGFKPTKTIRYPNAPYFCLHSKSFVLDRSIVGIGSYNLDPRSASLNTETMLVIWDKPFAEALEAKIKRDIHPTNSWVIAPRKRPHLIDITANLIEDINQLGSTLTKIDLWPFHYAASYELRDGKPLVAIGHPDFYKNYKNVGSFPLLGFFDDKTILTKLFKSIGEVATPVL